MNANLNIPDLFLYRTNVIARAMLFRPKQSPVLREYLVKIGLPRRHTCPGGRCQGRARAAARNDLNL